jgi:hypothetical protein
MAIANGIVLTFACLVGLAGCSSADGGSGGTVGKESPIESLSGEQLCRMLPQKALELQFSDVEFFDPKGRVDGRDPNPRVHCHYGGDALGLDTSVHNTVPSLGAKGNLELVFTDTNEDVTEYEPVAGLGAAAGYGPTALLDDLGGNTLAVILNAGNHQYTIELNTMPEAKLEQLKPLAEELLSHLEAALA